LNYDGLDASGIAALTGAPEAYLFDTVTSVLDVAHRLAAQGAADGAIVLAEEQTAGRGRGGRAWASPRGGGVWLAQLMRPAEPPVAGALALRCALALREALSCAALDLAVQLKWPNDVMVAGRKAAGVLCEARWAGTRLAWIAAGVGVNVRGPLPPELARNAIALAAAAPGLGRLEVLRELVPRLRETGARPGGLSTPEREAFLAAAWPTEGGDRPIDIEPDGALRVLRAGSIVTLTAPAPVPAAPETAGTTQGRTTDSRTRS
jgi:biotin-[acetyl-CoA-carboxylase] ligase BirA-like protein